MNIIFGFGITEKDFEKQEINFVQDFIKKNMSANYFSDEFIEKLKKEIKKRKKYYDDLYEKYKTAKDFPERYSHYYFTLLHDVVNICVIFEFSHINRKHPFSPDGWAMLGEKQVAHFHFDDFE